MKSSKGDLGGRRDTLPPGAAVGWWCDSDGERMRNFDLRQPILLTNGETEAQNRQGAHTRLHTPVSQGLQPGALEARLSCAHPQALGVRLR